MGEINWNIVITIGTIVVSISSAFMLVKNKTEQHEKDLNKLEASVGKEITHIGVRITESNKELATKITDSNKELATKITNSDKEITALKEKSIIVARDIEQYRNENQALKETLRAEINNQINVLSLQMDNRFDKLETLITNTVGNGVAKKVIGG
jgi:septal ring factor EnvC (AmiA/AmiB activator)